MAIVVEKEKQSGLQILYVVCWIILVIAVLVGTYYVFFKRPEIYEAAIPLQKTAEINEIVSISSSIDLNSIIQNPIFQSLKLYVDIPTNIPAGRNNPFSY